MAQTVGNLIRRSVIARLNKNSAVKIPRNIANRELAKIIIETIGYK